MYWAFFSSLGVVLLVLLSVAFFSLFERKVIGSVQYRCGPNNVSVVGFMQPIADALNLLVNVESEPIYAEKKVYNLAPLVVLSLPLIIWHVWPIEYGFVISEVSVVVVLLYFSVSVYGVIFTGWGSNSRYATLGSVRSICQSISYEIGISIAVILICLLNSSVCLKIIVDNQSLAWFAFVLMPIFVILSVCLLAEVSRCPFDLPEGESELVGGYSVEYGSSNYTVIFLGENLALLWASSFASNIFLGGSKVGLIVMVFFFVWVRTTLPRVRFDNIMLFFWLVLLPILLGVGGVESILP